MGLCEDRVRTDVVLRPTKIVVTERAWVVMFWLSFQCVPPPPLLELCPLLWLFFCFFCLDQTERRGDADVGGGVDNGASSPMSRSSPPAPLLPHPLPRRLTSSLTPHCTYLHLDCPPPYLGLLILWHGSRVKIILLFFGDSIDVVSSSCCCRPDCESVIFFRGSDRMSFNVSLILS